QVCNNQNDFDIGFDDGASPGALPCPPVGGGIYLPQDSLAFFNGENPSGTWVLTVEDVVDNDGGSLDGWGLEVCTAPPVPCIDPNSLAVSASANTICTGASVTLTITGNLNSATSWEIYKSSCGGTWVGSGNSITVSPTTTTTYYVRGEGGCVSPGACATETVVVNSIYSGNVSASVCNGTTYTFPDGSTSTTSTTQTSSLTGSNGCDSIIATVLTVIPDYNLSATASVCGGVVYTFPDGDTSSIATIDTSNFTAVGGCDSIIITTLIETGAYNTSVAASICPGGSYTFPDASTSSTATTNVTTLTSAGGCDSIVTTVLVVDAVYNINENVTVCSGGTYTFPDGFMSIAAIVHTSNLITTKGCDSIIVSTLTLNSPITSTENVSVCSGNAYIFPDGTISTVSMTHVSNLTGAGGCDSNITSVLTVGVTQSFEVNASVCNGSTYTFPDGSTSSVATVQGSTFVDPNGCDSVVITILTIENPSATTENAAMCAGDTYIFPDGITSEVPTIHISNLTSLAGCDSTVTTNLTITVIDTVVTITGNLLMAASVDAYQWIACDGNLIIGGATSQAYTVGVSADYKVALTENGCLDTSACLSVVYTGILENELGTELIAFPNPTTGHLHIDLGNTYSETTVEVIDLRGKLLMNAKVQEDNYIELDVEMLAQGMYLVKVLADDKIAIIKLLKE
ncbi:MAG: T9SS type A sorting domain-containing protein, partial [Flavobacteriales bacterium]|nr:T9SS type A sorting domain-containing protein [Flavobacteriales bacterium]